MTDYLAKHTAFANGALKECPNCGTPVSGAKLYEKYEPEMYSLYVLPCNCRLGLWGKAPDWIENVRVITLEDQENSRLVQEAKAKLAKWNAAASGKREAVE